MGLLISTVTKSQFVASQLALLLTFLPATLLSGFIFDLRNMPVAVRTITYVLPARYFVVLLQTVFLAGDVWSVVLPNAAVLVGMAVIFLGLAPRHEEEAGVRRVMLASILRIFALVRKEFLAIMKDPRSRVILFMPPLVQTMLYGYAATYDLNNVPYAVLNHDRTAASDQLLARLDGSGIFHRVANLQRVQDIDSCINTRQAVAVLTIDQDFERRLLAGRPANVQVIADGRNSNTAAVASGYIAAVVDAFNATWKSEHGQSATPIRIVNRAWYNPNLESRWNMVPALIGTLTMLGTLILTALSVAREREQGTFDQLLVTPFRPAEIMAGKAIPCMSIGLAQATTILLVAQFWFRIPFVGSYLMLYLGLSLFLIAAVGLGLFVSSIARTMQQAMLYSFMLLMPFTLLSGLTTPISSMPPSLQTVTLANPLRYAIDIAHRVYLEGAGIRLLWPELWPLAVIGFITLTFSAWFFRHRLT